MIEISEKNLDLERIFNQYNMDLETIKKERKKAAKIKQDINILRQKIEKEVRNHAKGIEGGSPDREIEEADMGKIF